MGSSLPSRPGLALALLCPGAHPRLRPWGHSKSRGLSHRTLGTLGFNSLEGSSVACLVKLTATFSFRSLDRLIPGRWEWEGSGGHSDLSAYPPAQQL